MRGRSIYVFLLAAVAVTLAVTHLYVIFYAPASNLAETRLVNVPRGASFRVVAQGLEKAGVVTDSERFIFAARVMGAYRIIKAGEYEFNLAMTPREVLDILIKGRVKNYTVTVPEGYNIREIAEALKGAKLIEDADAFVKRAKEPGLAASLGLEGDGLEGYLFPDTYAFTKGMTADEIIGRMTERFKAIYQKELAGEAKKRGMSMKRLVTLASIIEKETGAPEERPLISAVFHNRLKKRIKLQSDPTVIYAARDYHGNITRKHLLARTPYNTYVIYGLPPGPIASPGRASLIAALNPANADYLYFVSMNNGTHQFSKNLREHNRAVNLYQRRFVN